jgi:hypothetical protein
VPDLHQFSRMISNATGVSPRAMRQERRGFEAHIVSAHSPDHREGV